MPWHRKIVSVSNCLNLFFCSGHILNFYLLVLSFTEKKKKEPAKATTKKETEKDKKDTKAKTEKDKKVDAKSKDKKDAKAPKEDKKKKGKDKDKPGICQLNYNIIPKISKVKAKKNISLFILLNINQINHIRLLTINKFNNYKND